jgi:tetratricopeptide (TPR) repeat protein
MQRVVLYIKKIGPKRIFFGMLTLLLIGGAVTILMNREYKLDPKFQEIFDKGSYVTIINSLEPKIKRGQKDPETLRAVSAAYIQKARDRKGESKQSLGAAISYLTIAIRTNPQDTESYRLLGVAYFLKKDYDAAQKSYLKALETSKNQNTEAYVGLGMIDEAKGDLTHATYSYLKALKIDPSNESAELGMARWSISLNKPDDALSRVNHVIKSNNKSVQAEAYTVLGSAYILKKNYNKAITLYKSAVTAGSKNAHLHVLLAQAYINQYFSLVRLANQKTMVQNALAETQAALQIDSNYIYAYTTQYQLYMISGDTERAKEVGTKIVSLVPGDPILTQSQKKDYIQMYKAIPKVEVTGIKIDTKSNVLKAQGGQQKQ